MIDATGLMPKIIDYEQVLATLTMRGMRSLYHNSGSFELASGNRVIGWIGPDDPTIRDWARSSCRQLAEPHAQNLAQLFERAWTTLLPGEAWIMPASHWSYELDFGSDAWMPEALRTIGIDPAVLQPRNNAAAIAFHADEAPAAVAFIRELLERLTASDFTAAFPTHPVICTIHHHVQLWWRTTSPQRYSGLSSVTDTDTKLG